MTKHFLITAAAVVTFFPRVTQAQAAAQPGDFVISKQDDLKNVPGPLMIAVYNDAAVKGEGKQVVKFADKETGARRVWPTLDFLAKAGTVVEGATATRAPRKAREAGTGVRGRTSQYAGMVIRKIVKENPRREGTHGYKSYEVIRDGMKFETFITNGGRLKDLAWDISYGRIKMEKAS